MPATARVANAMSARSPSTNSTFGKMREVVTVAGAQVVGNANRVAAAYELLGLMRSDEAGAAGDEVRSHSVEVECKS